MYDPRMIPIAMSIGGHLAASALPNAPVVADDRPRRRRLMRSMRLRKEDR